MKTKFILSFILGFLLLSNLFGATITSNGNGGGNWSDGTAFGPWFPSAVPVPGDDVIILTSDVVTADIAGTPISCNSLEIYGQLIIDNGVTLTVTGSDGANTFGQNFTIESTLPGSVINNGTLILDQSAGGAGALYEDQAGASFTNTGTFTIDNGGNYAENGALVNSGTINISNNSSFDNNVSINNNPTPVGVFNVGSGAVFSNYSTGDFALGNGTINVNAGATYNHSKNGGTVPICTWNTTSTCLITGVTTTVPTGIAGVSFGNFTWNCSGQSTSPLSLAGNLTTVTGDLTISDVGSNKTLQLCSTQSPTINISGNLIIAPSGTDLLQVATTGVPTVNVGGNVTFSSGKFILSAVTGSNNAVLNITGNLVVSSSAGSSNTFSLSGGTGIGTINLTGNFNYLSSTTSLITETSTGTGVVNFVGDVTHTFNTAVVTPFVNKIQVIVTGNDILDISSSTTNLTLQSANGVNVNSLTINTSGTLTTGTKTITVNINTTPAVFTLSSGATLNTNNVSGVNATIVAGGGTRTFDNAANYVLGGASTTTGFAGANTTMNNLTTTASATLGASIIVNGAFLNSAGTFTAGANTITVAGNFTNNGTFAANTSTLNIASNFSNGGTFNANTGTVVFNGSVAQTIGGASTASFYNINSNNTCVACGVSLAHDENLVGTLTINSRTFTTSGFNFTLISNASGTASIGPIVNAGADIVGNIIMQRYVPAGANSADWRLLGSAISDATATFADWTDNFTTSGFVGSSDPSNSFVSIYLYDETTSGDLDQGYIPVGNASETIWNGMGYFVYMGPVPLTVDITGAPNKGSISLPVSFTANFGVDDDGWNLVSNPYPCAIDWDAAGWSKQSMDDAVYIYNASTGTYAYHCPVDSIGAAQGINGNGGSNYIASQQAFWVKTNTDSPQPDLTADETVKVSAQNPVFLKTGPFPNTSHAPSAFYDFPVPQNTNITPGRLKLTATGTTSGGVGDEMFIHFKQGATNNFDGKYDAWKFMNDTSKRQNFSSVISGNKDLAVNGLPSLTSDVHIPLRLRVPVCGCTATYTISRDSILMLPLSSCITLEDKKTGGMIDLRTNVSYSFTISDTTRAPRFILHISAPITKKAIKASCPASSTGKAIAQGTGTGPWNYLWKNSAGTVVKTTIGATVPDTLFNCLPGTYSVSVNGAACGSVTDTIIVGSPAVLTNTVSQIQNVSCFAGNNGSATISTSGGTPGYSYLWANGQSTALASNLSMGNYSVTITDLNGCTSTASVSIGQPSIITNSVVATNVSCFGGANGSATISTSGGTSGYTYLWGNGQSTSLASNLSYGNYSVTISDANGCTSTASVSIGQPSAITNTVVLTNVSCFGGSNGSAKVFPSGGTPGYSYLWSNGKITSLISNLSSGNYSVKITDTKGCTLTSSVSITQPVVLTNTVSSTQVSCYGEHDGSVIASASGGNSPYSFLWNCGLSTSVISGLSAGNYSVSITDSNGCKSSNSTTVIQPALLTADFTSSTYTVDIALGSNITLTNTSSGASAYKWNFGDASDVNTSVNPTHSYSVIGTYTVTLISSNVQCADTAYKTIVVINSNPTVINGGQSSSAVNVAYDNGQVFLLFSLNQETKVNISVYNMLGEELFSQKNLLVKNERVKLDFPSTSAGIYIAVSEMKDAVVSKKIFIPMH